MQAQRPYEENEAAAVFYDVALFGSIFCLQEHYLTPILLLNTLICWTAISSETQWQVGQRNRAKLGLTKVNNHASGGDTC